jgi:RNA-dependent RNA polymerase
MVEVPSASSRLILKLADLQSPFKMAQSPRSFAYTGGPRPHKDWTRIERPVFRRSRIGRLALLPEPQEWQKQPDLSVILEMVHVTTTTYDLYQNFKQYIPRNGDIVFIEIFEDIHGARNGRAKIRFAPPPKEAFWQKTQRFMITTAIEQYNVTIKEESSRNKNYLVQSPIRKTIWYEPKMKLWVNKLHFGIMTAPNSVMPMYTARPIREDGSGDRNNLTFSVDLRRRKIEACFEVTFKDPRSQGSAEYVSTARVGEYNRVNKFKFWIPFDQLQQVQRFNLPDIKEPGDGGFELVITLKSPPPFYRKREDQRSCHSDESCVWSEFDSWSRQTDIVYDPYRLQRAIVTLRKEKPVIDIGISRPYCTQHSFADTYRPVDNICLCVQPRSRLRSLQADERCFTRF